MIIIIYNKIYIIDYNIIYNNDNDYDEESSGFEK